MVEIRDTEGRLVFTYEGADTLDFDSADLRGVNLGGAVLEGAFFSDADLSGACLEKCDLYWAMFFRTNLSGTNLKFALLMGCDFKEANLTGADLSGANLGRDNVGGRTQLEDANLSGCKTEGTIFSGAKYNARTIFPEGFDPEEHMMVRV
jgi:uncharacterized protein YjbI with pentapeptide repeats